MSELQHIIHIQPTKQQPGDVTIEQIQRRRVMRKKRVARRMAKRFPLFAVEIMQEEFPEITYQEWEDIVTTPTRKRKSTRKKKTPMVRQGRYQLYREALGKYRTTGEQQYLQQAQELRNRMYSRFRVTYQLAGEQRIIDYPSTYPVRTIRELVAIKFSSWAEMETREEEITKWVKLGG